MKIPRAFSVKRYAIDAELPRPESEEFLRRLAHRRFRPLSANEERAWGWVSPENLLVTDLATEPLRLGRRVVLSFRIDRRRVNPRLLRAHLDLEVRARAKAGRDGGGPGRITRDERRALKKELHDELLRQAAPSIEAYSVVLDLEARTACLLTLSKTANEAFKILFRDTFEVEPTPVTPWQPDSPTAAMALASAALRRSEFAPRATKELSA